MHLKKRKKFFEATIIFCLLALYAKYTIYYTLYYAYNIYYNKYKQT